MCVCVWDCVCIYMYVYMYVYIYFVHICYRYWKLFKKIKCLDLLFHWLQRLPENVHHLLLFYEPVYHLYWVLSPQAFLFVRPWTTQRRCSTPVFFMASLSRLSIAFVTLTHRTIWRSWEFDRKRMKSWSLPVSLTYPEVTLTVDYLTLRTPEAGIPTLRKLPYGARSRYTVGTVCQRLRQKSVYRRHSVSTPGARNRYTDFVF